MIFIYYSELCFNIIDNNFDICNYNYSKIFININYSQDEHFYNERVTFIREKKNRKYNMIYK